MRALLAAITCRKHDLDANLATHLELLEGAARDGCELAVFPEFSLTGSVDPLHHAEDAIAIDHAGVGALVAATQQYGVAAVFGLSERRGDEHFITQLVAADGQLIGTQRKRHLGEDEQGYSISADTVASNLGAHRIGIVICAEAGVDSTWDATTSAGAEVVLFCSAPGLYGRCTDEAAWAAGLRWWEGCGLGDARRHAERLGVWVAMATQAGTTVDEDFPGLAALIAPDGTVVDRLADWREGTLVVDIP
ncbi:MAG TPA: carbon-nitrogen hydrolase family protein [Acidimicrobiia bacterium]